MIEDLIKQQQKEILSLRQENKKAYAKGQIETIDKILDLLEKLGESPKIIEIMKRIYNIRKIAIIEYSERVKNDENFETDKIL